MPKIYLFSPICTFIFYFLGDLIFALSTFEKDFNFNRLEMWYYILREGDWVKSRGVGVRKVARISDREPVNDALSYKKVRLSNRIWLAKSSRIWLNLS